MASPAPSLIIPRYAEEVVQAVRPELQPSQVAWLAARLIEFLREEPVPAENSPLSDYFLG